ncbi:MAG TPA: hypothetical protein VFB51_09235 [Solirubrobacterales bacterium]|nr:hypothetical protein [Solirubrobacterales bacterium]
MLRAITPASREEEEERDCWLARIRARTDTRVAYLQANTEIRGDLENRCARKRTESSNLSPSAQVVFTARIVFNGRVN